MPIKLRKSHSIRDKATGKMKQEHSYMKMADIKELKERIREKCSDDMADEAKICFDFATDLFKDMMQYVTK